MEGKIWVESEEGKGSTFFFTAKLDVAENQESAVKQSIDLKNKKVLMVDDNSTNRLIINKQLSSGGALVTEAANGKDAIEIVEELKRSNDKFDVILVDCRMPEMDGFELIESLKSDGIDLSRVLMLSSADLGDNVNRAREMGIARFLVKPIKQAELIQQLEATHSDTATDDKQVQLNKEVDHSGDKPLKILLVEDNPDNRLLINAYLKKLPYELDEAENGQIAVEKFQTNEYDIVLMDVQMPVMDGHESTRTIRAWESEHEKQATPIISLTAHAIKEEIDKCIAAGCDTHLAKPVKKTTLIDTIKSYT
jgi:CheY-like chemotaxis protein